MGRSAWRARLAGSLVGGCLVRFVTVNGRDRVFALAGQAFTAIVPLLIVLSAVGAADDALADRLVEDLGLRGAAAEAVRVLFSRPPGAADTITVVGLVVLLVSVASFARALQRTWEVSWGLSRTGVPGRLHALAGMGLLVVGGVAVALLAGVAAHGPGGPLLPVVVRAVGYVALWVEVQHLLLTRRVVRRRLVPGALVAGLGQVAVGVWSAAWMPRLINVDAGRYGVIGVTFALLTWLIVLSAGVVVAAVVSAECGTRVRAVPGGAPEASTALAAAPPGDRTAVGSSSRRPRGHQDRGDRFGVVLLTVLATAAWTMAAPDAPWAWALVLLLLTATLFGALRAALAGPRLVVAASVLWVVAVAAALTGAAAGPAVASVLLLAAALGAVVRRLAGQPEVSWQTVQGAVSAYLLIGLVFTFGYAAAVALAGASALSGAGGTLSDCFYFSFATLTTTGYGDVTPGTGTVRSIAILEALLGQLYLVTVLALAVGNLRPRRRA